MPTEIGIEEVQRLLGEESARLVEVRPQREFNEEHLVGAIDLSLKELTPEAWRASTIRGPSSSTAGTNSAT